METTFTDNMAETIAASAAQLKERIDHHHKLIAAAFGSEDLDDTINDFADNSQLRQALYETIETLDETRKAFKSKRLETLRKKLMKVLMETGQTNLKLKTKNSKLKQTGMSYGL